MRQRGVCCQAVGMAGPEPGQAVPHAVASAFGQCRARAHRFPMVSIRRTFGGIGAQSSPRSAIPFARARTADLGPGRRLLPERRHSPAQGREARTSAMDRASVRHSSSSAKAPRRVALLDGPALPFPAHREETAEGSGARSTPPLHAPRQSGSPRARPAPDRRRRARHPHGQPSPAGVRSRRHGTGGGAAGFPLWLGLARHPGKEPP